MNNKEIYKKTIGFSLWRVLWDFLGFAAFIGFTIAGFVVADKISGNYALAGLGIGAIFGAIGGTISGIINISESDLKELDSKSKKFAKLHAEA